MPRTRSTRKSRGWKIGYKSRKGGRRQGTLSRYVRRKTSVRYSRRAARVKVRYGHNYKKKSLRKRVATLEAVQNKHWDQVSYVDENIYTFGTRLVGQGPTVFTPGDSFKGILRIQGRGAGGDPTAVPPVPPMDHIPSLSGVFVATDTNTRESSKVYCTKVRLRGLLRAAFPQSWTIPESTSGTDVYAPVDASMVSQSKTKIWLIVLKDKQPSIQLADGSFAQNPLPNSNTVTGVPSAPANLGPLEQLFQHRESNSVNTLTTFGYGGALRKYDVSRFKPILSKAFELSCNKPEEEFDVTININKMLRYKLPRPGVESQLNVTEPLNCQYLIMFSCCHDMPTATDGLPDGSPVPTMPPTQHLPTVMRMTSRTYFRDV